MNRSELARRLNISRTMVYKLIAQGMPCDSLENAARWRKENLNPAKTKSYRTWLNKVRSTIMLRQRRAD